MIINQWHNQELVVQLPGPKTSSPPWEIMAALQQALLQKTGIQATTQSISFLFLFFRFFFRNFVSSVNSILVELLL